MKDFLKDHFVSLILLINYGIFLFNFILVERYKRILTRRYQVALSQEESYTTKSNIKYH